jgi:hypothetical protein
VHFEVSERIQTRAEKLQLLDFLDQQFRKVASGFRRLGDRLEVKKIEASFGSINRHDETMVELKPTSDGFLVLASVNYRRNSATPFIQLTGGMP